MTSFYATIVLPTHDRASTLGMAIESVLAQSVTEIEIVIVGDGCTQQVREVANAWVGRDSRVRFLDLSKGAGNGHAHRDAAVRAASADRVFFIDDDDLYLPIHVETLGRILDSGADVADTPAVSVSPVGRVDFGLHDFGDAECRRLYAAKHFKPVFDTHLAVVRAAYVKSVIPPHERPEQIQFPAMLSDMARAADITWCTVKRATALSLHGARRSSWTDDERRDELALWCARLSDAGLEAKLRADASMVMHTTDLLYGLAADGADAQRRLDCVSRLALAAGFTADSSAVAACCALPRLQSGEKVDRTVLREFLRGRLDASLGPWSLASWAYSWVMRAKPAPDVADLLEGLALTPDTLLLACQVEARRDGAISDESQSRVKSLPARERFAAGLELASVCVHILRDADAARQWLSWARSRPGKPRHAKPFDELAQQLGVARLWE